MLPRQLPPFLIRLGRNNPWKVVAGACVVWVAAGLLASRVRIETDILSLIPRDNPVVEAFRTTVDRFGSVDTLLIVVHIDSSEPLESTTEFADEIARQLRTWDLIDWVEYRVDVTADAALPILDRAVLFLDPEELEEFLSELQGDGLDNLALRLRGQLMAPQSLVTEDLLRLDPAGLLPRILDRVRFGGVGVRVDPGTGCLIDPDRRLLLMMAKPIRPAQDLDFSREIMAGLSTRMAAASQTWQADRPGSAPPSVEFTGGYPVVLEDARLITTDTVIGLVTSLVGVMLLFLLAFRSPAALLYAFLPLATGIALSLCFAALALGRINSLTSAFGGLIIGLGIDFVIVLYARYVEERRGGASSADAIDAMGRSTGASVLLGAVTTAATFYAFLITDFAGLWELGLLTGTGILLLVLTVYLMLPALLTILEGGRRRRRPLSLHSFGSDLLCRWSLRRPVTIIILGSVVTVGLAVAVPGLQWDDDFSHMRSTHNRAIEVRQEVMDAFNLRFSPMTLRFDGASEAAVLERCRAVLPELRRLVEEGELAGIDTIADIIPPPEAQQAVVERLIEAAPALADLRQRFEAALRRNGLNPLAFGEGLDHLMAALQRRRPLSLQDLQGTALTRVVDRYVARTDGEYSAAMYLYPPRGSWRQGAPPGLVKVLDAFPDGALSGINVISAELRRIVWQDAIAALVLGLIGVYVLMWADLGSLLRTLLALLPLAFGMVWMLGAMAVLDIRLNFFNIFVLTMIVGIGVDYGVHLIHRWFESGGDPHQTAATAKAISVAALTTMVGFGSLVLSHFPGLRSVGAAAMLGAAMTAVLAISVLPAILTLKERSHDS